MLLRFLCLNIEDLPPHKATSATKHFKEYNKKTGSCRAFVLSILVPKLISSVENDKRKKGKRKGFFEVISCCVRVCSL